MPRRPRELDPRLTPAQLGVLAVESLADPGLERPSGVVPTPLAEALAAAAPPGRARVARPRRWVVGALAWSRGAGGGDER